MLPRSALVARLRPLVQQRAPLFDYLSGRVCVAGSASVDMRHFQTSPPRENVVVAAVGVGVACMVGKYSFEVWKKQQSLRCDQLDYFNIMHIKYICILMYVLFNLYFL